MGHQRSKLSLAYKREYKYCGDFFTKASRTRENVVLTPNMGRQLKRLINMVILCIKQNSFPSGDSSVFLQLQDESMSSVGGDFRSHLPTRTLVTQEGRAADIHGYIVLLRNPLPK